MSYVTNRNGINYEVFEWIQYTLRLGIEIE